jgi:23S rRNA (guanosine2251-2'-O)-methyltransferase
MGNDQNYIFGINPVREMLQASPTDILEIIIAEGHQRQVVKSIEAGARRLGLRVTYVASAHLDRLAQGQRHQGVTARVREFGYSSFAEVLKQLSDSPKTQWILLLDGLTDPRNFGAILRTAEAVGIEHVIIPKDRAVRVTSVVARASAGAVHHLRICIVTNLRRAIADLKAMGFWIVGLHAQAHESLYDADYPRRLGIVLGSEGTGVRPLIQKECDFLVSIPMVGKIASLNVAVAGGVFFYELLRRNRHIDNAQGKS